MKGRKENHLFLTPAEKENNILPNNWEKWMLRAGNIIITLAIVQ